MSITLIPKLLITLLGLTLPGYALARALRLKNNLAAAFPFSALLICQTIVLFTCLGWKLSFVPVLALLTITSVFALFIALHRRNPDESKSEHFEPANLRDKTLICSSIAAALLLILAVAFRTTIYPLGGFDTFIRWDALAREMLKYGNISFYPPLTGADFSIYTMPDGFPPLVASVYWWLYATIGTSAPQITAIPVTLQLASILGLTWAAAETAFGKKAASFTLLALTASPLLIRSVEIGQESGFLALAVAGQLCFVLAAIRKPSLAPVYAAALFAALGAMAREYGVALALPGLFILLSHSTTRRHAWKYALLAAVVASPWYIRNWIIAGSPLYPVTMPGSSHSNQLLSALMDYYGEIFGIANFGTKEWLEILYELAAGFSVALLAALPYLAKKSRKCYPYILSLTLITLLWLWSIGKTSGGVIYSMRVLAPAVVILALIAGKAFDELSERGGWRRHVSWLLIPASLWGALCALSFPLQPMQLSKALLSTKGEAPEFCEASRGFAKKINSLDTPATGILTDSPYLAVILKRETRFRPVIIWSSEVSSILSPDQSVRETEKRLQGKGISLVALKRSSIHNDLLFRIPLYRDGVKEWKKVAALGDWALFAITPEKDR